jgi:predicted HicB family RNase H-like nuclease
MNDKILNMRIPTSLYEDIKKIAIRNNISLASMVRLILSEYANKNK